MTQLLSPLTSTPYPSATSNAITDLLEVPDAVLWIEKYVNMRFASTAARDAAIPVPEDGMIVYVQSSPRTIYYYNSSLASWRILLQAPAAYTPAWTVSSGTPPALNNGTLTGTWSRFLDTVQFAVLLTLGSTSTRGVGPYRISLPATSTAVDQICSAFMGDASVGGGGYTANMVGYISASTTSVGFYAGTAGASSNVTESSPQLFAVGDRLWASGSYQAV